MSDVQDFFNRWSSLIKDQKPTQPTALQEEFAELLSSELGIQADPLSIYPVNVGELSTPVDGKVTLDVTFTYDEQRSSD